MYHLVIHPILPGLFRSRRYSWKIIVAESESRRSKFNPEEPVMRVSTQPRSWGRAGCVACGRSPTGPITQLGDTKPGILRCYRVPMPRCHMHEWLRVKDVVARATRAFSGTKLVHNGMECQFS